MLSRLNRRNFFRVVFSLLGSVLSTAQAVLPLKSQQAVNHLSLDEAIKHLFGTKHYENTQDILIQMPGLAEDGGNVPITIKSTILNVRSISIFSDKNPLPLIAVFKLVPVMEVFVKTRIKMAESGQVIVFMETDERLYRAEKALKVVVGGCDVQSG